MMMPTGNSFYSPRIVHGKKTPDTDLQVIYGLPADLSGRVHQRVHAAGADASDCHVGFSHCRHGVDFRAHDIRAGNLSPGSPTSGPGRRGYLAASAGASFDDE